MKNFTPPTLEEFQEFGYNYAISYKYIDFPIDRNTCYRLLENSYEYWFDDNCKEWKKSKRSDWKRTVMQKVRSDAKKMRDWGSKEHEKYESV